MKNKTKGFKLIFLLSLKRLLADSKNYLTILLTLVICVLAILFLVKPIISFIDEYNEALEEKKTWHINSYYTDDIHETSINLCNMLFTDDENLPKIKMLRNIHAYIEGAGSFANDDFMNSMTYLKMYVEDSEIYEESIDIVDGRMFLEEEISSGANVIILTLDSSFSVGDEYFIAGTSYEVIGIADIAENLNTAWITKENIYLNNIFAISFGSIVFKYAFTEEQEEYFIGKVTDIIGTEPINYYYNYSTYAISEIVTYILLILLLLFCGFLIISAQFDYMSKSRVYEFNIYKILGCRENWLCSLYYLPILIISVIGSALGIVFFCIVDNILVKFGLDQVIPIVFYVIIFLAIVLLSIIIVLPKYLLLLKSSAIETR